MADRPRRRQPSRRERRAGAGDTTSGRGRRVAASRARRRRARVRTTIVVALLALVAVAVAVVSSGAVDQARDLVAGDALPRSPGAVPDDPQPAVTLVTTLDDDGESQAVAVTVLAVDRESGEGTVVLVPTTAVTDVPGFGTFRLGEAHGFGGAELLGVSLDNLLQIRVEHVAAIGLDGWSAAVEAVGGVPATFGGPATLATDDGELRIPAGRREVDGPLAATLLTARASGEAELDVMARGGRVITGLLDRASDPDAFAAVADGLLGAADGIDEAVLRTVLAELAVARAQGQLTVLTLPVSPLGTGDDEAYRPDTARIAALVEERLAASRPDASVADGRRLQVLNGNGRPGVGAAVAQALQPAGYRVALTGNADRFSYEVTRIVVHDDDASTLAAARDVRDRLGVGEIERAGTPQSVVDLTIVVGRDFPSDGRPG